MKLKHLAAMALLILWWTDNKTKKISRLCFCRDSSVVRECNIDFGIAFDMIKTLSVALI